MGRRKRSDEIVASIERSLDSTIIQDEKQHIAPLSISERGVPADQVALIVERIVNQADIDSDVLFRSVDEGLILGVEKMKKILGDSHDHSELAEATRTLISVSNNLLTRKRLNMSKTQRVHVTIGDKLTIGGSHQKKIDNPGQQRIGEE